MSPEEDNQKPVPVIQVVPNDTWSMAIRWVFGQEVSTVLLCLILVGGGYMTYWHLSVGVPLAEQRRHDYFAEISKANNDAHKDNVKAFNDASDRTNKTFTDSLDKVQSTFEREIDRVERRNSSKNND